VSVYDFGVGGIEINDRKRLCTIVVCSTDPTERHEQDLVTKIENSGQRESLHYSANLSQLGSPIYLYLYRNR